MLARCALTASSRDLSSESGGWVVSSAETSGSTKRALPSQSRKKAQAPSRWRSTNPASKSSLR